MPGPSFVSGVAQRRDDGTRGGVYQRGNRTPVHDIGAPRRQLRAHRETQGDLAALGLDELNPEELPVGNLACCDERFDCWVH